MGGFLLGIQLVMLIMQVLCFIEILVNKRNAFEVGRGYAIWSCIPINLMNFIT